MIIRKSNPVRWREVAIGILLGTLLLAGHWATAQSQLSLRVMAANLTSGNQQSYLDPGIRIFQGLQPDIVCVQEFNYGGSSPAELRSFVDTAFGTNFHFIRESESGYDIPNGIISRWPILAGGSWDDSAAPNRGFAWAQIDLPETTNDLYVVSVHLLTANASTRNAEATQLRNLILTHFPADAWIIVGGDCNTDSRAEACLTTFKTFLSDSPRPHDGSLESNENTNASRQKPYDYVLPSFSLTNFLTPVVVGARAFPNGLVFDSRVYSPLSAVAPVQAADSGALNMQHMGVIKDFVLPLVGDTDAPIILAQPQSQTNVIGATVTFTVSAIGTPPLTYQWFWFGTNLPFATNATLSLPNVQSTNAGAYAVVITNAFGNVTSHVAQLVLQEAVPGEIVVLAGWEVGGLSNYGPSPFAPTTNAAHLTVTGLTRGTGVGVSGTAAASAWGGNGFDSSSLATAEAGGDFVTFAITAADGYTVSFTNLNRFDYRRSNTGPANGALQYQLGAGNFITLANLTYPVNASSGASLDPVDLAHVNALQNVPSGQTVTFRIVNFGATSAGGTWYIYDVAKSPAPDFSVMGSVNPSRPPTDPPALPPTLDQVGWMNGQFQFTVNGTTGSNYVVQVTTNLHEGNWRSVRTNSAPFVFVETDSGESPQRFYRGLIAP